MKNLIEIHYKNLIYKKNFVKLIENKPKRSKSQPWISNIRLDISSKWGMWLVHEHE